MDVFEDPYDRYEKVVSALYARTGSVSWTQEFEAAPPEMCTPRDLCNALLEAVQPGPRGSVYKEVASNWMWRAEERPTQSVGGEVALERAIVSTARAAGRTDWMFRMPTMSGVTGPHGHNGRSIDLVRRVADGHYELIELKTASDNPAHAAFGILYCGLAYCRARESLEAPVGEAHAILNAHRIDLVVLAPRSWYRYSMRHAQYTVPYALNRLSIVLNEALTLIRERLALPGLAVLTFGFKVFENDEQLIAGIKLGGAGKEYARGRG